MDSTIIDISEEQSRFDSSCPFVVGDVLVFPPMDDLWSEHSDNVWKIVRLYKRNNGSVYADLESCYNDAFANDIIVYSEIQQLRFANKIENKSKKEWCCCVQ